MYLQYFGLSEPPFSITPDPRFVYLSPRHEDALAHLQYGIGQQGSGGFVQLTGEVGTGKTTLCRTLLEQLPEDTKVALILNPALGPIELLEAICHEFKINLRGTRGSLKRLVDRLNRFLLRTHADGETAVLLIDEAQNLSPESLEQVRLLTNLETPTKKLLQIILLGQPELRDVLARPDLRQLAQRITARYHLTPLSKEETAIYVDHRMTVAGNPESPFSPAAHRALHKQSGGVPRLINIIAERALLAAYADGHRKIGAKLVNAAASEVRGDDRLDAGRLGHWPIWRWASVPLLALALGAVWWWSQEPPLVTAVSDAATPTASNDRTPLNADPATSIMSELTPAANATTGREPAPNPVATQVLSFEQAWAALLNQRGLGLLPTIENCAGHVGPGTYCLSGRTNWRDVARLDRPVALHVPSLDGFVIARPDNEQVRLLGQDQAIRLSLDELLRYWNGRYWDVFALPGYVNQLLREGQRGPAILWAKEHALAQGYQGDVGDPYFGPALSSWVRAYQRAHELPEDGVIGPRTLQLLSRADVPPTANLDE